VINPPRELRMARHGIDYESVKQAALKLLSQGISPSVQKIRECLGTGSHTTIAEHLKNWREEYATKKVHHLPATMPKELITTFERLWQTAMEHAEQQLANVKEALDIHEEKLQQEKILNDKVIADLKSQLDTLNQKLEDKRQENQALQTQLAMANERLEKQANEIDRLKQQYELRWKHLLDEKHHAIEKIDQLQTEVHQHQQQVSDQTEKHQVALAKERELQAVSEKRWVQLIDQARLEASHWRKKYEDTTRKQSDQIDTLHNQLVKLQDNFTTAKTTLDHKNEMVHTLNTQLENMQTQHTITVSELAVLKSRLKTETGKKLKKIVDTV
jgi:chromosome segregation ATPase